MLQLQIFKLEYTWYEGEYHYTLLAKDVDKEQFEKDLIKAKEFAESLIGKEIKKGDYLGRGYRVGCLPEYYNQIIWFLNRKLRYIECDYDKDITYDVDDPQNKKISVKKSERKIERKELTPKRIL